MRHGQEELPVAYFSRKLLPRERSYAATELEGLALVTAVEYFTPSLITYPFQVETDHRTLTFLNSARQTKGRLACWAMRLQPFTFTIRYRPGNQNANTDALSRQAWDLEDESEVYQNETSDQDITRNLPGPMVTQGVMEQTP